MKQEKKYLKFNMSFTAISRDKLYLITDIHRNLLVQTENYFFVADDGVETMVEYNPLEENQMFEVITMEGDNK